MEKIVTTKMTETSIEVSVAAGNEVHTYSFPYSLVNPRTSLGIASLLCQDPSMPKKDGQE